MRYLVALLTTLTIGAVACGPSSKEIGTAKSARYQGDKLTLFAATKAAVESKYKLHKSDETTLGMQTEGKWYTPEGMAVTREGGNATNTRDMGGGMSRTDTDSQFPDGSVNVTLVVTLLPDGSNWIVKVTPVMLRFHAGMPKPDPLPENDPSVPGWATSKVDQLAFDIHQALSKYEVKQVGGVPPPPAPGPSPDEPSAGSAAAPPAAGSAAGSAAP